MAGFENLLAKLQEEYKELSPIFIVAPTQRCGTTLLQRAINAGGEAVIYGENFFLFEMLSGDLGAAVNNYDVKLDICKSTLEAFKQGKSNIDGTALFPDFAGYIEQILKSYFDCLLYYHNYSKKLGFKHWGFKHQPQEIGSFINSLIFLPNVRMVFIYRDLIDVAKSMKARWPALLDSDKKLVDFGNRWAENTRRIYNNNTNKVIIKYEDLITNPEQYIPEIEALIAAKIDRNEFKNKVNAHFVEKDIKQKSVSEAQESGHYIKPAELTEKEIQLLLTHAKDIYQQLGYQA